MAVDHTKERPILFSGEMVRAILDGRKTQTRRVVKFNYAGRVKEIGGDRNWHRDDPDAIHACPYGVPGDRLWVREAFSLNHSMHYSHRTLSNTCGLLYRASWPEDTDYYDRPFKGDTRWKPSIHMPRWACRILLEVVSVRVERVRSISTDDAISEGMRFQNPYWLGSPHSIKGTPKCFYSPEQAFGDIWDSIYAGRGFGWDVNPRVWAIEFKVITKE